MQYEVIRLSEIEGQGIIEGGHPGLLPFAPLMKRPVGMASEEWLRQCIRKVAPISPYISERIETGLRWLCVGRCGRLSLHFHQNKD